MPTRAKVLEAEHELEQATSARPQDPTRLAAALEQAVDACRRWPEATAGVFYLPELLGELSEAYEQLGRTEDALDTMRSAITAGYTGAPDPRCRLAEILLRAGRAEEAHPIFTEVKAETPDDVWLYNNAGLEYGAAGDHERALEWLTEGLELALSTGDPERLVAQMSDLRRESLDALGRELDELEARADEFLAQPSTTEASLEARRATGRARRSRCRRQGRGPRTCSCRPGDQSQRWPGGLAGAGLVPSRGVRCSARGLAPACRGWVRRTRPSTTDVSSATSPKLAPMPTAHGPTLIAPIQVDRLRSWCSRTGNDPASGSARASYAAELARTASADLIAWPPARNEPCWCRSGRKYKQCCGHPSVAATPVVQLMARTWLSIRVELVEGGGHDSIWPRPGRIRRADSRERRAAAPQAEIRSLRLGSAKMRAGLSLCGRYPRAAASLFVPAFVGPGDREG